MKVFLKYRTELRHTCNTHNPTAWTQSFLSYQEWVNQKTETIIFLYNSSHVMIIKQSILNIISVH